MVAQHLGARVKAAAANACTGAWYTSEPTGRWQGAGVGGTVFRVRKDTLWRLLEVLPEMDGA